MKTFSPSEVSLAGSPSAAARPGSISTAAVSSSAIRTAARRFTVDIMLSAVALSEVKRSRKRRTPDSGPAPFLQPVATSAPCALPRAAPA